MWEITQSVIIVAGVIFQIYQWRVRVDYSHMNEMWEKVEVLRREVQRSEWRANQQRANQQKENRHPQGIAKELLKIKQQQDQLIKISKVIDCRVKVIEKNYSRASTLGAVLDDIRARIDSVEKQLQR